MVGVSEGTAVGVSVGISVAVAVGTSVWVGVLVGVSVAVAVGISVCVGVLVGISDGTAVGVAVGVGVAAITFINVGVTANLLEALLPDIVIINCAGLPPVRLDKLVCVLFVVAITKLYC